MAPKEGKLKKARILVVEDEGVVAFAIQQCLLGLGYDVPVTVDSGEAAITKAAELRPDLVLMDIRLKGDMDGIEAAKRIAEAHGTPVIYLTAHSDGPTLERAKVSGPYGYILKPFDERALQTAVEMSLYRATIQAKLQSTKDRLESILGCIGDGIIGTDAGGRVDFANAAALKLIGCTEAEAQGAHIDSLLRLIDAETHEPRSLPVPEVALEGTGESHDDCMLLTRGGTSIAVEYNLAPLPTEGPGAGGAVVAFRDTTARRREQKLIKSELASAAAMQRSLLPSRSSTFSSLRAEWLYHPSLFGSGDLFDVFSIDNDKAVVFYMLDVAGHGISAAAMSTLLHRFLSPGGHKSDRDLLRADPLEPAEVVRRLNTLFYRDRSVSFFSIVYGVLEPRSGKGRFVRAGHHYPLHQRADGSTEPLQSDGTAVGVSVEVEVRERDFELGSRERLYVFSDGVVECLSPAMEQFTVPRLRALVQKTRTAALTEAVKEIDRSVQSWRGTQEFDDDLSLLALERS